MALRWSRLSDLVFANWAMKVTALALAAVLWVAVAAEEPATEKVAIAMRVRTPEGRSLTEEPPAVSGVFAGAARELLKLYANPPVIHIAIPDTARSDFTVALNTGQIELPRHVDVRAQTVEPRTVTFSLEAAQQPAPAEPAAGLDSVSERVLMGVPVTIRGDRGTWSSEPPAVIVTVHGSTVRLARLTRDSIEVSALPEGSGEPETVRLQVVSPDGIDAVATPDTAVVQRRARA
ncbi:MAG: hypothetical protein HY700_22315 [Gemmatimonadetes bacterium]|nr:hypothetical protein [Gemmatimonadota bacterium]